MAWTRKPLRPPEGFQGSLWRSVTKFDYGTRVVKEIVQTMMFDMEHSPEIPDGTRQTFGMTRK
ncbi:hypothetical protein EYF80_042908 [Liparis tanakae]|uniref:Uncharacterized protein n=1 Tax=Liparis tanakae TaxID=230148 RepID=A0A4Z2G2Z6_9TELE|nr:hypothetical protein EYF80_042908 [Liparis tanakae]